MMLSSMNAGHPGYMGHMDTIASTMSVVGDLLASALNNNMLSLEMSPAFSRLEDRLLRALALRFGLGAAAGGVMAGGGTLANLQALTVARNHAFDCFDAGIQGLPGRPVVLASENAHVSFLKATMLLGAGTRGLVGVKADAQGRMEVDDLWRRLQECRERGDLPYCVVGVAGTTVTGSIDPLEEIGALCREEGLWFHVDAAFGGAAILSEKHKHRLRGVDQADSLTWNPQKWLYVAKTCAMVLFRRAEVLKEHYRLPAPYMRAVDDFTNLGELSIQGTRRPDALKLWLTLAHLGRRGLAQLIDGSYALAEHLADAVDRRDHLRRLSPTDVSIVCFTGSGGDAWNSALQHHLLERGTAFLSYPHLHGRRVLKAVTINPYTDTARIDAVMAAVDDFARANG
jgi:glutamate/tyrosine decarboxylase-like PLP-dependent enzyme